MRATSSRHASRPGVGRAHSPRDLAIWSERQSVCRASRAHRSASAAIRSIGVIWSTSLPYFPQVWQVQLSRSRTSRRARRQRFRSGCRPLRQLTRPALCTRPLTLVCQTLVRPAPPQSQPPTAGQCAHAIPPCPGQGCRCRRAGSRSWIRQSPTPDYRAALACDSTPAVAAPRTSRLPSLPAPTRRNSARQRRPARSR